MGSFINSQKRFLILSVTNINKHAYFVGGAFSFEIYETLSS